MKIGGFDLEKSILLVAEIGNNHEGNCALAEEMIGLAKAAGADAVKFQTYRTEDYVSPQDRARFEKLKSFELSYKEFEKLRHIAEKNELIFLSTPFDLESVDFLKRIVPAFKISSGDNNFYPLLEKVARTGKPVILSSGFADLDQMRHSKSFIEDTWKKNGIEQDIAVLHCVSSYPVSREEANLAAITCLKEQLQCTVGYSDHTVGIEAAALSVALGARIIEKHFTIDKNYSDFRDHKLAADPGDFARLAQKIKEISVLLGAGEVNLQDSEKSVLPLVRRSIVAKHDLPKGTKIERADITWVRPGGGIAPGEENRVIGSEISRSLEAGAKITAEFLKRKQ